MIILGLLFAITALIYASIGFGGGSTYNALLVLYGTDYRILPSIALCCNLAVTAGGSLRYIKAGHIRFTKILPWVILSIPMAWVGGQIPVSEVFFIGLLGFALLASGLRMLLPYKAAVKKQGDGTLWQDYAMALIMGGTLGLLAGLTGIGGGIFLAPVLYFLRWGSAKEIAGTCSLFICVNSAAGLAGQMQKIAALDLVGALVSYWPLLPAVIIGGFIGSWLGTSHFNSRTIKTITAVLILYVAGQLLWRWSGLIL